jgi:hypothetical protein
MEAVTANAKLSAGKEGKRQTFVIVKLMSRCMKHAMNMNVACGVEKTERTKGLLASWMKEEEIFTDVRREEEAHQTIHGPDLICTDPLKSDNVFFRLIILPVKT